MRSMLSDMSTAIACCVSLYDETSIVFDLVSANQFSPSDVIVFLMNSPLVTFGSSSLALYFAL